jgi:guanylate kinase
LEIDVQGTLAVLQKHPAALTIFVRPDTVEELESRLRQRQTENEAAIERRLETALRELQESHRYQHVVINRDVGQAALEICQILTRAKKT